MNSKKIEVSNLKIGNNNKFEIIDHHESQLDKFSYAASPNMPPTKFSF